ncbi:GILT protein C02D5.2-like [Tropilaelaps mercedesae]|uniref:GILT protein C02D5.2-like n=1 Tax=Tropilaelaps mercedesae TaxID=418985 RepID=A0A1V9X4B1_9ACAR|nr:GILT protein C02D5.2-like [Tropilaelaps mercedesae]
MAAAETRVELYYETHCPDSQHFMKEGLRRSLQLLPEVDFVLVPYGKASTSGTGPSLSFQCQHGAKECEGNTYHACAIELHSNKKQVLEFAVCTMSFRQNVLANIEKCAVDNGIDYNAVKNCATGHQGKDFLAKMGELTQAAANKINGRPQLDFVPSTIIDGTPYVYDSYSNLHKTICANAKQKPCNC